jgi:prepilin-type N-terminal cleavage/methylation domain-containing protein
MEFKIMFIKFRFNSKRGFTLVETLVAAGLFGIASAALCTVYAFSTRSFASLANYAELDQINRTALDTLTREIRQARVVTDVTSNSISFINGNQVSVIYNFDAGTKKLMRYAAGSLPQTLLSDCNLINFDVYQRNNISNTFDQYPAATNNWNEYVKVIRLTWKASRTIATGPTVSENVQTARVVIRKQH